MTTDKLVDDWFIRNADTRNPDAHININRSYFAEECAAAIMSGRLASQASTDRPVSELVERAWSDFVNCADDRYFGNKSRLDKQKAVLRRLVADAQAPLEADNARLQAAMREAVRAFTPIVLLHVSGGHEGDCSVDALNDANTALATLTAPLSAETTNEGDAQ